MDYIHVYVYDSAILISRNIEIFIDIDVPENILYMLRMFKVVLLKITKTRNNASAHKQ